eukprot:7074608-Prymnesium_polylepis.1
MPAPLALSSILRAVPLARRTPAYYTSIFVDGESTFCQPESRWAGLPADAVLELGAGRFARWSERVGASAAAPATLIAADLEPPACRCARCIAADNTQLDAAALPGESFDLIYGSHVLCTCRWIAAPWRYIGGAAVGKEGET